MSTYLQVACGPFPLLLAAEHVVEIGEAALADAGERRLWREGSLPVVRLAQVLGGEASCGSSRREQVVVGVAGEARAIADVDRVLGLCEWPDSAFRDIAGVDARLDVFVDGVLPTADGQCLLRLRHPYPWLPDLAGRSEP